MVGAEGGDEKAPFVLCNLNCGKHKSRNTIFLSSFTAIQFTKHAIHAFRLYSTVHVKVFRVVKHHFHLILKHFHHSLRAPYSSAGANHLSSLFPSLL
jgi:hypothetical protein